MKVIKKHKYLVIGLVVFLVLVVLGFFAVRSLVYPDLNKNLYGNRLDGIEEVAISDDTISQIKQQIEAGGKVKNIEYDKKGRLLNFIIDVGKDTDLVTSKSFGDKIISGLKEEMKAFYDIQLFISCSEDPESELYPIIGYKHKTSVTFIWDQEESKS